jgi:hypothetical protein
MVGPAANECDGAHTGAFLFDRVFPRGDAASRGGHPFTLAPMPLLALSSRQRARRLPVELGDSEGRLAIHGEGMSRRPLS